MLFKPGWKWVLSETQFYSAMKAACCFKDSVLGYVARHWPSVCFGCWTVAKILWCFLIRWKDCFVRGSRSFFELGTAALLVIIWSCFLSLTSMTCLLCVVLCMVRL